MVEIIGTTPDQRGERRVRVRYEQREGDGAPCLYLAVMVRDNEVAEVRTSATEVVNAILREAGVR